MTDNRQQQAPEIPQRILVLRDFCIRTRGASCTRCAAACPKGALAFEEGKPPVIDVDACTLCGICEGACDAFTSTRDTVATFHAAARRAAMGGRPCIMTCTENLAKGVEAASNVVALPCLAMAPAELWCALLAEGADVQVSLDLGRCEHCDRAGAVAEDVFAHNIELAEAWTGRNVGFCEAVPEAHAQGLLAGLAQAGADGSRRSLFTDVFAQLKDAASGQLRERTDDRLQILREQNERLDAHRRLNLGNGTEFNAFAPHGRVKTQMGLTRKLLLQAIDAQPGIAERAELSVAVTDVERCASCLRCARACPTGARKPDPEDGSLSFDWRYCTGCGLCADACPKDAVTLQSERVANLA